RSGRRRTNRHDCSLDSCALALRSRLRAVRRRRALWQCARGHPYDVVVVDRGALGVSRDLLHGADPTRAAGEPEAARRAAGVADSRRPVPASRKPSRRRTPRAGLGSMDIIAFAPTTDPKRARMFFENTLGLPLVSEDAFALVFDAHGVSL